MFLGYGKFLAVMLLAGGTAFAADTKVEKAADAKIEKIDPFKQALSGAYSTNSTLRAKVREQFSRDEEIPKALAGFRPNITTDFSGGKRVFRHVKPEVGDVNRTLTPAAVGVSIQQDIYSGGGTIAATNSAEHFVASGQYDYLLTEQDTLLNAISAYMNVIFQTASVRLNKANKEFLAQELKAVQAQVELGEKTPTDTAQAEARLARAVADLIAAEGALQNSIANYVTVIGEKPGLMEVPAQLADLPASREQLVELARQQSFLIARAQYTAQQAKSDIAVSSARLQPSISLEGRADRALQSQLPRDQRNLYEATLKLSIPLYQKGSEWAGLRQSTQTAGQRRFDLEQSRKQSVENAINAWENWVAAKERITQFKAEVVATKRSRDGAVLEAEVGQRAFLDVLDSQRDLVNAQLQLEQAKRDEVIARYQMLSVIGLLTADYLKLPVESYDIIGHYKAVRNKWIGTSSIPLGNVRASEE